MNRTFTLILGLAMMAPAVSGCAAEDEESGMPKYPEAVGYDVPSEPPAEPTSMPAPASPPPAPMAAPQVAQAQDGFEAQPGDVAVGADPSDYEDTDPSALTDFHTALDPYGSWVDDPTYGTVWTPSENVVGDDFTPYVSSGYWTYDDYDNYVWVSSYDWGWAPFHYGRWAYLGNRWGWIPGRRYAGAWVSWRYGGGYVGWAPLPPTWYWRGGYAFGLGVVPYAPYSFCGYHDVFAPNVGAHVVAGGQVAGIAAHTQPYVPAHPTVGGAGRTPAHPVVGGPSPSALGLGANEVAHTPANNAGVLHAQAYARPSTAQGLGAHAPAQMGARSAGMFAPRSSAVASAPRYTSTAGVSAYGRMAPVATAPRYQGVAPTTYHYQPTYSARPGGAYPGASRQFGSYPSYGSPRYSSPSYSQHFAPSYSPGSGYHGSYGHPSSGSAPSESAPAPAVHSSGGFRGGGGGGGFRGGGGGHAGGGGHR